MTGQEALARAIRACRVVARIVEERQDAVRRVPRDLVQAQREGRLAAQQAQAAQRLEAERVREAARRERRVRELEDQLIDQNRKYLCASGSVLAGAHVRS